MKKRILSLALALTLMLGAMLPIFATSKTISSPGSDSSSLQYVVAQSFTVTIPESVTISGIERKGAGTITVANAIIPFGQHLTVTITDATNFDTNFRLKDGANDNYIGYSIKKGDEPVTKNTAFLTISAGTAGGSLELTYVAETPTIAGNYSDTLTFTVAVG